MSTEGQRQEGDQQDRKIFQSTIERADDCPVIYTNYAAVTGTPFDLQIMFSDILSLDPEKQLLRARAQVRVVMAPEHAALLIQTLVAHLEKYVANQGKLRKVVGDAEMTTAKRSTVLADEAESPPET